MIRFAPLFTVLLLLVVLGVQLTRHDNNAPSQGISDLRLSPDITLPSLDPQTPDFSSDLWQQKFAVINIFASWCLPCAAEMPLLNTLNNDHDIAIYGIGWKDSQTNLSAWLNKHGNPFNAVGVDTQGSLTVPLGLTGVPETMVVAANGEVLMHIKMPLSQAHIDEIITLSKRHTTSVALSETLQPADTQAVAVDEKIANKLFREIRCVVCAGESIAESRTDVAQAMRDYIHSRLAAGDTPEAIKSQLSAQYGQQILMRPPLNSTTLVLWLLPLLLITIAGIVFWRLTRRKEP